MIDVENDVFDYVANAILTEYPNVDVSAEYAESVPSLPAVTIEERDNSVFQRMRTEVVENAAVLMYEVAVYSNKTQVAKSEAKAIFNIVDEAFAEIGFVRTMRNQIPNYRDQEIHRIVARYEGVAGPLGTDHWLIYSQT